MFFVFYDIIFFCVFLLCIKYISYDSFGDLEKIKKSLFASQSSFKSFDSEEKSFDCLFNQAKKKGLDIESSLTFLVDFFSRLNKFYNQNKHVFILVRFRLIIVYSLSLLSSIFLKIFFINLFEQFEMTQYLIGNILALLFCFYSLLFLREKMISSFFYQIKISPIAYIWLQAYLLGETDEEAPFTKEYRDIERKMRFSGISFKQEKKFFLEHWLVQQELLDQEKQEKLIEILPIYELFMNTLILIFLGFPFVILFFSR